MCRAPPNDSYHHLTEDRNPQFPDHDWETVWNAKVEPKCRFFCWLLFQRKILTSDKITRRGAQAGLICKLCTIEIESPKHLVANCSFSRTVWSLLAQKFNLPMTNQTTTSTKIKTHQRQLQTEPKWSITLYGSCWKSAAGESSITKHKHQFR